MTLRLRRSELSTPASSEKMIEKASKSQADLVFLDLEDSVAPTEKAKARQNIVRGLNELDWGNIIRAVRINNVETEYAHDDVLEILAGAGEQLDVIIIPKVKSARDVWFIETLLDQAERKLGIQRCVGLEVLIEEVEALVNVDEIARSSERLEALIFGPGDMSASQGVRVGAVGAGTDAYPGDLWHYAHTRIVVAARAARIDAIDGPYANFHNEEGYLRAARWASTLGFVGKWAIHPSQIEHANHVYSPTQDEIESALEATQAYAEAEAAGHGAVAVDGVGMVDAASIRILENTLARAKLGGQL